MDSFALIPATRVAGDLEALRDSPESSKWHRFTLGPFDGVVSRSLQPRGAPEVHRSGCLTSAVDAAGPLIDVVTRRAAAPDGRRGSAKPEAWTPQVP
jgi:hypothetical protein